MACSFVYLLKTHAWKKTTKDHYILIFEGSVYVSLKLPIYSPSYSFAIHNQTLVVFTFFLKKRQDVFIKKGTYYKEKRHLIRKKACSRSVNDLVTTLTTFFNHLSGRCCMWKAEFPQSYLWAATAVVNQKAKWQCLTHRRFYRKTGGGILK